MAIKWLGQSITGAKAETMRVIGPSKDALTKI